MGLSVVVVSLGSGTRDMVGGASWIQVSAPVGELAMARVFFPGALDSRYFRGDRRERRVDGGDSP